MSDNDETAPVPRFPEPPAAGSTTPVAPQYGYAAQDGSAPQYGYAAQDGSAPQYGPVPATAAGSSRPSRRTLAIIAGVIGGVLLVGTGFGAGLVVGHRTAQWEGRVGLVSRLDQRGEMQGPGAGYGQGRGGQARPFGGQGAVPRGRLAPAPAVPTPAPSS